MNMIKDKITFTEMKACVDEAVALCFKDEEYLPYMKEFATWYCIMKHFTDAIPDGKELDEEYFQTMDEELISKLMENKQVCQIYDSINDAIKTKIDRINHKSQIIELLDILIDALENPEVMNTIGNVIKELETNGET